MMLPDIEIKVSAKKLREDAIRECLVWLAVNHSAFRPEYLAGEMAQHMLDDYRIDSK